MTNKEFYDQIKLLMTPYLGLYSTDNSQQLSIAFHNQPRNVKSVTGLEVVVMPRFRELLFLGEYSVHAYVHPTILQQNEGADDEHIYVGLDLLQRFRDENAAYKDYTYWADGDFTQGYVKTVQYSMWLPDCGCYDDLNCLPV